MRSFTFPLQFKSKAHTKHWKRARNACLCYKYASGGVIACDKALYAIIITTVITFVEIRLSDWSRTDI